MKFDIISDQHGHLWGSENPDYAAIRRSDIAIVAGDLHRNPEESAEVLKKIAAVYKKVLFVEGNNEFRDSYLTDANFNIAETEDRIRLAIEPIRNALYLKDYAYVSDGVAVIGRNGHWNHKADARITQEQALIAQTELVNGVLKRQAATQDMATQIAKQGPAPGNPVVLAVEDMRNVVRQAERDFTELRDEVMRLNADKDIHTIVVVTHTVPHLALLNFPDTASPLAMSTMMNTQMESLKDFDTNGKLKHWVFAHQIDRKDMVVNGVRFIQNPLGGPRDALYPSPAHYRVATVDTAAVLPAAAARPGFMPGRNGP
jgi:hypothetical protein